MGASAFFWHRTGIRDIRWRPKGRLAGPTTQVPVCLQASLSGARTGHRKVDWDLFATSEVHFVGRLARECGMRNDRIIFLNIEADQLLQGSKAVERMQDSVQLSEAKEIVYLLIGSGCSCCDDLVSRPWWEGPSTAPLAGGHGRMARVPSACLSCRKHESRQIPDSTKSNFTR